MYALSPIFPFDLQIWLHQKSISNICYRRYYTIQTWNPYNVLFLLDVGSTPETRYSKRARPTPFVYYIESFTISRQNVSIKSHEGSWVLFTISRICYIKVYYIESRVYYIRYLITNRIIFISFIASLKACNERNEYVPNTNSCIRLMLIGL